MSDQKLIEAIEALTEAVSNLTGYIEEFSKITAPSLGSKTDSLSEQLSATTKAVDKLTTEVTRNTFK